MQIIGVKKVWQLSVFWNIAKLQINVDKDKIFLNLKPHTVLCTCVCEAILETFCWALQTKLDIQISLHEQYFCFKWNYTGVYHIVLIHWEYIYIKEH